MKEKTSRQQFSSKAGFLISAIGSAVGLGNIWRYPYVAFKNGGGAFLLPYFIALITSAIPILILEYIIGNKFRGAPPLAFARIKRKFEFVGWIPSIIAGIIIVYYSAILSWSCNYLAFSFNKSWGGNTENFFYNKFLHVSSGALNISDLNIPILIVLAAIWLACYFVCSKDISKGLEKVNKVLLPLMVISMLCIVIRGITLENSSIGLNKLFTPDWGSLINPNVWVAAYGQVFFSLSVAMGIMITYSSYLPPKSDLVNTSFIAGLSNSAFEITVAMGVFGILGFMAGTPENFDNVVKAGPGLAFVVFPTGINMMPGISGQIIGILFFLCLVAAGFTSFISLTEAFSASFIEKFNMNRKKMYKITCTLCFVLSILFATNAGIYILDIVDFTCNTFGLTIVGILEAVVIMWILKKEQEFVEYSNKVSYIKLGSWWSTCVKFIFPVIIFINLILSAYSLFVDGYETYKPVELITYCGATIIIVVFFTYLLSAKVKWPKNTAIESYTSK